MSHRKQFTLYTHFGSPNGWKVPIVLEELGLTYESVYLDFQKGEQSEPTYATLNPNRRIPTLVDHQNGDFAIWESGAIYLYLADKYDTERRLSVAADDKDRYSLIQWLFFQASGQGPYYGQAFWFMTFHPEKLPSAIERYQKETARVFSVLDAVLAKPGSGGWLVGGTPTVADLSFVTWNNAAVNVLVKGCVDAEKEYPAFYAWHQRLLAREPVKKVLAIQASLRKP